MKLNKPIITICLIILLVINLIFFCFLSIGQNFNNKEYINEIVEDFDFKNYLLNNYYFKESFDNYKYPKEIFNYLDDLKIKELKEKFVNNLFEKKEVLIEKEELLNILSNSVREFEINRNTDIFDYVLEDLNSFVDNVDKKINNDLFDGYSYVIRISSTFYSLSIVISILLIGLIIFLEKEKGIVISSIVLLVYSFFVFYFNKYFLNFGLKDKLKYFKKAGLNLDGLYFICFIIGFILLLIYIVKVLRRLARNIRINSYNRR